MVSTADSEGRSEPGDVVGAALDAASEVVLPPRGREPGAVEDGGALVPAFDWVTGVSTPTTRLRVEEGAADFERYSTTSSNWTAPSADEDVFDVYVIVTSFLDCTIVSRAAHRNT